jgi:hypothetical protein
MSGQASRSEQGQVEQGGLPPASRQRTAFVVASSLAQASLGAAGTVSVRMLGFGVLGAVLGTVGFFAEWATGLLAHPWAPWRYLVFVLLLVNVVAGALLLGTAGMWRGIGRVAMDLVQKHGLARHIVERIFERAAVLVAGAVTPEALRAQMPLVELREKLREATAAYAGSDDVEKGARGLSRAILRRIKLWLCRKLEARFLEIVGEVSADKHVAEVTLERVRERAVAEADGRVEDLLDGLRNKQAGIWVALFVALLALPPILLVKLR